MKVHVKKKKFKDFCREQVKKGLINQANGNWSPWNDKSQMDNHMRAGYKIR